MFVFSLFFIVQEKVSVLGEPVQSTGDVFSSKLIENYGKYYFYSNEIYGQEINHADLKIMTQRSHNTFSWLQYAFFMKVIGNDKEAFEGFSVMRKEAQRTHEIDDHDITVLSRIIHEDISKQEVPSAVQTIEKMEIGWFEHIVCLVLYRSVGMEEEAENVTALALHEASGTVQRVLFIATALFLSFIAGIIVIVVSVRRGRIFRSFDQLRLYKLDASYLFETFVLWLFIATLLKFVIGNAGDVVNMIKSLKFTSRIWFMIALYLLPCVSLLYLQRKITNTQFQSEELYGARGDFLKNIAYGVGGYLASIPLLLLSVMITIPFESALEKFFPTPSNPAIGLISSSRTAGDWILLFFLISCIAPVVEEILFRGVLQNAIKRKTGPWSGILLSACIFSLLHPQLPLGFLPLMVLGIVFGILAESRKSLVPSIIAHGMNNGVVIGFVSIFT
jgi:membrane protease YdiL (CAAX protease family)